MLINGKLVDTDDPDTIIEQLRKLPSGFSERCTRWAGVTRNSQGQEYRLCEKGMAAFKKWEGGKQSSDLEAAMGAFRDAAAAAAKEGNILGQVVTLANYGRLCRLAGKSEERFTVCKQILSICKQHNFFEHEGYDNNYLYDSLGNLHAFLRYIIAAEQKAGKLQEANELRGKLRTFRKKSLLLGSYADHGEPVNPDAFCIEQGEVGFSAQQPMGTRNIGNCVCIMVRNPVTQKTSLAHIDAETDPRTFRLTISRLLDKKLTDKPLEVRLVGAKIYPEEQQPKSGRSARLNIKRVVKFLASQHVNIISAAIFDPNQPSAVVVNPFTFTLAEAMPGVPNPNMHLANGKADIAQLNKPLHLAFDLTRNLERAPVILTPGEIRTLKNTRGKNGEEGAYEWFEKYTSTHYAKLPVVVEWVVLLAEEHKKSVDYVVSRVDKKIADLKTQGIKITSSYRAAIVKAIDERSIYVGVGSEKANQPLVDYITDTLLRVDHDYSPAANLNRLRRFKLSRQPDQIAGEGANDRMLPPTHLARNGKYGFSSARE